MPFKQIEEAIFARQQLAEPAQHLDLPSRPSTPINSHNAPSSH
jgi:hypothetical protein